MPPLTRADLDRLAVADGGTRIEHICGECHPNTSVLVRYESGSGVLAIVCAACQGPVMEIQVASRQQKEAATLTARPASRREVNGQ